MPPRLRHEPALAGKKGNRKRIAARHLAPFSDTMLADNGLPGGSPVVVLEDGVALENRAVDAPRTGRDHGTATFERNTVLFAPTRKATPDSTFTLALNEALPVETHAGPVWWVYASTGMTLSFRAQKALVGTTLTARVWAKRLPGSPPEAATFTVAGQQVELTDIDGSLVGSVPVTVPAGEWQITVDSPSGGPHLVLERLTLSDGDTRIDLLDRAR